VRLSRAACPHPSPLPQAGEGTRWLIPTVVLVVASWVLTPAAALARRQPPPAVVPTEETQKARDLYKVGRYGDAVLAAKAALNKNERYTPAMLVMAKSYYKLHKYEWMKKLWEMMQANGASNAEKAEIYQLLAFLEVDQKNVPGAIILFKQAAEAKPDDAILWNNLGAQYLAAKNYADATPVLERSAQLQPGFAKSHLNLGDAYRGLKQHERAQEEYQKALQLFPNYADAVFNLGILYLDADKMPNMDLFAKENAAIQYFQRYKQMMGGTLPPSDPADSYILEAQDKIKKEEKRLDRLKKQQERESARAAKKAADDAKKAAAAAAAGQPAPGAAPPGAMPPPPPRQGPPPSYPPQPPPSYPPASAPPPSAYPQAPPAPPPPPPVIR
jgi:tetratricopeptide (TPR) repeat protein